MECQKRWNERHGERNAYLNRHARIISGVELICAWGNGDPTPLMRRRRYDIVLLPIIQVPRLAIATHAICLWSLSNALSIATLASAHDEYLLLAPKKIHRVAQEKSIHSIDDN